MTVRDDIETYCGHFAKQLRELATVSNTLYRKILLVAVLDTLARVRHPTLKDNNRERFLALIRSSAGWPDKDRISLPNLAAALAARPTTAGGDLLKEVAKRLEGWQYGTMPRLNSDPRFDELTPHAKLPEERRMLEHYQHQHENLLYLYRNTLVHEFREPGHGMEFSDDEASPYYHGREGSWELVYPVGFFAGLAARSLGEVKQYLIADNLTPYNYYEFGSPWPKG